MIHYNLSIKNLKINIKLCRIHQNLSLVQQWINKTKNVISLHLFIYLAYFFVPQPT